MDQYKVVFIKYFGASAGILSGLAVAIACAWALIFTTIQVVEMLQAWNWDHARRHLDNWEKRKIDSLQHEVEYLKREFGKK